MAKRHGRNAEFHLADAGGTVRNVSGQVSQIDMPRTVDTVQVTGLGEDDHVHVVGVRGGTIRLQGWHTEGTNELDEVMESILGHGTPVVWKFFPHGSVSTFIVYSGSAIATGHATGAGIAAAASGNGDLQIHGSVTRAAV